MKLVYVTTQLPPELHRAIKKTAKKRGLLLAEAYRQALKAWLERWR